MSAMEIAGDLKLRMEQAGADPGDLPSMRDHLRTVGTPTEYDFLTLGKKQIFQTRNRTFHERSHVL